MVHGPVINSLLHLIRPGAMLFYIGMLRKEYRIQFSWKLAFPVQLDIDSRLWEGSCLCRQACSENLGSFSPSILSFSFKHHLKISRLLLDSQFLFIYFFSCIISKSKDYFRQPIFFFLQTFRIQMFGAVVVGIRAVNSRGPNR